jgi:glycosyltransferase involved in cell wall biosynthesis
MRILIVTDAWSPQINGVVRTLGAVGDELQRRDHEVRFLTPQGRRCWPMPLYPEIRLAMASAAVVGAEIDGIGPDAIHLATEGPLGWAARRACLLRALPFTTGFHTRFADYIEARLPLPGVAALAWHALKRFHAPSRAVMAPAASMARELERRGFANVKTWTRGVDFALFRPWPRDRFDLPRPILVYAGRIAVEKNVEAFLDANVQGTKVLVGDGPQRSSLAARYPRAVFTGYLHGADFARALAAADVFVFPSRTDTFGLVMLEAMACGTPVAAFDVPSPIDVVKDGVTGALDPDLATAIQRALALDRDAVAAGARQFTWQRTAAMFESWLATIDHARRSVSDETPLIHLR